MKFVTLIFLFVNVSLIYAQVETIYTFKNLYTKEAPSLELHRLLLDAEKYYFIRNYLEIEILSSNFEILLDSAHYFQYKDDSLLNEESRNHQMYIDKQGRLYIQTNQGISPLYPSFFKSTTSKNQVSKSVPIFVDENGYIVSE